MSLEKRRILPLASTFVTALALFASGLAAGEPNDAIRASENLARMAVERGEPLDAIEQYERALELRDEAGLGETTESVRTIEALAAVLEPLGRTERAEALLRRAIAARENLDGPEHAKVRNLLGRLSKLIAGARPGEDEAEELLLRKLALGDDYFARREMAEFYRERDEHDLALEHLHEAVALADGHPQNRLYWLGPALANLAREYEATGYPDLAETYLLRALAASEEHYGERHPYLVWILRNLGEFYVEHERYVEAEAHLLRALELKQVAYGQCGSCDREVVDLLQRISDGLAVEAGACADEAEVATPEAELEPDSVEARLAALDSRTLELIARKELAAARETALESLGLREESYGIGSIESAESLALLARVANKLRRQDEETQVLVRYLEVLESNLPARSPVIAGALRSLGRLARRAKDDGLALEYLTRESYLREAAGQNLALARTMKEIAALHHGLGDDRKAGEAYMRAADLWELMAGRHAADYVKNRVAVAESFRSLGLVGEAEAALLELAAFEEDRTYPRPDLMLDVLKNLERVYKEAENPKAAGSIAARIVTLDPAR